MKDNRTEKGCRGRAEILRKAEQGFFRNACGFLVFCILAAGAITVKKAQTQPILLLVWILAAIFVIPVIQSSKARKVLMTLQDVGNYEYEKIREITSEKEWLTLLADLFIKTPKGYMTLWLTVIAGGNIYMYVPAQAMNTEEIEENVQAFIAEKAEKRRIYAYDSFDDFEDMIMMLAANRPMKKDDDSELVCKQLLKQAQ